MPHPTPAPFLNLPDGVRALPVPGGYFIRCFAETECDVFVVFLGQSARIVVKYVELPWGSWHDVYCYLGPDRLLRAILAANAWDRYDEEPVGYDRHWESVP